MHPSMDTEAKLDAQAELHLSWIWKGFTLLWGF